MPSSEMWRRVGLVCSLQPSTHAGSSLVDFSTMKMEALRSSETSIHTRTRRHHMPENNILHSHFENLGDYGNGIYCLI
jgi:hypothetical protein